MDLPAFIMLKLRNLLLHSWEWVELMRCLFLTSHGDHKLQLWRLQMSLLLVRQMESWNIGTQPQVNAFIKSRKTPKTISTHLTSNQTAHYLLLLVVINTLESTTKQPRPWLSQWKRNLNSTVTPTESSASSGTMWTRILLLQVAGTAQFRFMIPESEVP